MHVMTAGPATSSASVVFESALGCPCTEWVTVQAELASAGIRSIAYDRPGIGWSPGPGHADTPDEHVHRLKALLGRLEVREVVLVGHSVGGLLVRSYWRREPSHVTAMMLIDASHPDQHVRSSRQREGLRALQAQLQTAKRRPGTIPFQGDVAMLPAPFGQLTHSAATSYAALRTTLAELNEWRTTWSRDAALTRDLDDLPLTILSAGEVVRRDPAHRVLQQELLALSKDARQLTIDGATHQGIVMDQRFAAQVAAEIVDTIQRR